MRLIVGLVYGENSWVIGKLITLYTFIIYA